MKYINSSLDKPIAMVGITIVFILSIDIYDQEHFLSEMRYLIDRTSAIISSRTAAEQCNANMRLSIDRDQCFVIV